MLNPTESYLNGKIIAGPNLKLIIKRHLHYLFSVWCTLCCIWLTLLMLVIS